MLYIGDDGEGGNLIESYECDDLCSTIAETFEYEYEWLDVLHDNKIKLEKVFDVDVETVYSYLEKLSGAHILKKCSRYDLKGREILKTFEKYYIADISLRHAILGFNKDAFSGLLENVVYIELLRRGYEVYVGKYNDLEIDFVAEKQGERIYIQVAQEIRDEKTIDREYENLLKIQDNYPKYVLSTQDLASGNYAGIKSMHIADWLLAE